MSWRHAPHLRGVQRARFYLCAAIASSPAFVRLCSGDLNNDGLVDDSDFTYLVSAYNILDCTDPGMSAGCPADLTGDGFVDDADFVLFIAAYDKLLCG